MPPLLRPASPDEADDCLALLHDFARTESLPLGSVGWTHPRVRTLVHDDAAADRLYVVRDGPVVAATFALCDEADPYFAAVTWAEPDARVSYLHRLAVAAGRRGTGLGSWCVAEAERLAAAAGSAYLRLDALRGHPRVLAFYERLGYADCGITRVESGDPRLPLVDLVCFEKRLVSAAHDSAPTRAAVGPDRPAPVSPERQP